MNELDASFVLKALQMAIHEAEGWYDDCRGAEPDGRVPGMHYCYEQLEKHGMKTLRELASQRRETPEQNGKRHP